MRKIFTTLSLAAILAAPVFADSFTLCPANAGQGGFNNSFTTNTEIGLCSQSVTMGISNAQDYAKLTWGTASSGWPAGLTLGDLLDMNATVNTSGSNGNNPFYLLAFTDPTDGLGQGSASDQILMIEFQNSTTSGNSMPFGNSSTQFNLYDNTTGKYLLGGQADTNTLAGWTSTYSFLSDENVQGVWIGMGLGGGSGPGGNITIDSVTGDTVSSVPEPGTFALGLTAVAFVGLLARRRAA